jgi:hypothetical protein
MGETLSCVWTYPMKEARGGPEPVLDGEGKLLHFPTVAAAEAYVDSYDETNPGRYANVQAYCPLDETFLEATMDGFCYDEYGSVDEDGWYGLVAVEEHGLTFWGIASESCCGFRDVASYDSEDEARDAFDRIVASYPDHDDEDGEEV